MQALGRFKAEYYECHFKSVGDELGNREYNKSSLKSDLAVRICAGKDLKARHSTTDLCVYETFLARLAWVGPIQLVAVSCNSPRCWPG